MHIIQIHDNTYHNNPLFHLIRYKDPLGLKFTRIRIQPWLITFHIVQAMDF